MRTETKVKCTQIAAKLPVTQKCNKVFISKSFDTSFKNHLRWDNVFDVVIRTGEAMNTRLTDAREIKG